MQEISKNPTVAFTKNSDRAIPFSDSEFVLFRNLIHEKAGIYIGSVKKIRLAWILQQRLQEKKLATFEDYFNYVQRKGAEELQYLIEIICTHETRFFREPRQLEYFQNEVLLPYCAENAVPGVPIRIWSAGCSSGEEPFTLAMILLSTLSSEYGRTAEVLATDISGKILDQARSATWPIQRSENIPERYLKAYMLRGNSGKHEKEMRAGPELRRMIHFQQVNLQDFRYPVVGPFDFIFCRNVLIYFQPENKERVVAQLSKHLRPGGYLFLGHAEAFHNNPTLTKCPIPATFRFSGDKT